jgi:hypothetical protein
MQKPACPLWGRGQVEAMKKRALFLFFSVSLLFAGCGKENRQMEAEGTAMETEAVETEPTEIREMQAGTEPDETEGTGETELPEEETEMETESLLAAETVSSVRKAEKGTEEVQAGTEPETRKREPKGRKAKIQAQAEAEKKSGSEAPVQTEPVQKETPEQTQPASPETEKVPEPVPETQPVQEPQPVPYSPGRVAELATAKTKACGKTYIPDDLNRMLSEVAITEEDYHACYPTDGAGYLEYYVASDLNEARDVSGTVKFGSEEEIAANIAGMYGALPQQYFYIEYHGTAVYGGKECYVFYCYRA